MEMENGKLGLMGEDKAFFIFNFPLFIFHFPFSIFHSPFSFPSSIGF